jgi:hypothetical protein
MLADRYRIARALLSESFDMFRACGQGARECQLLWLSDWSEQHLIHRLVHPYHRAHAHGFEVDGAWLNRFWLELAQKGCGIRMQVHTHPLSAFHSPVDDRYPFIHTPGFLSLVIPNFGLSEIGFEGAYLTQIQADGRWCGVSIPEHIEVVE